MKLLKKIFDFAKRKKIKIAWNPGGSELKQGLGKLKKYIAQTEVFNLNREEASELAGISFGNLNGIIKKLSSAIQNILVITDGAVGAYALKKSTIYFARSLGTKAVNTTGAGDAFGSGFVAGLIIKNNLDYALRLAILNSDGVIRKMGAKNGLLESRPNKEKLQKVKIEVLNFKF